DAQRGLNRATDQAVEQQEPGETKKLAQRQRLEADAVKQFQKQLSEIAKAMSSKEAELSQRFQEMADGMGQSYGAGQWQEAAARRAEGLPGDAASRQSDALRGLESLEDTLEQRPPDDQDVLVKKMQQLETGLEQLHKAEEQLAEELRKAAGAPESPE